MRGEPLIRSWGWAWVAVAYLTVVYATLPFARPIWRRIEPLMAHRETLWFLAAGVVFAAVLGVRAWSAGAARRVAGVTLLAAVLAAYVALLFVFYRGRLTLEKVHLLEYGVLAYLTLNAVTVTRRGGPGGALALLFVAFAGAGDEALQKVIPERVFDPYDIVANWLGAALGGVAWIAVSPRSPWRRDLRTSPRPRSEPASPPSG
jgi:hypothetical protein